MFSMFFNVFWTSGLPEGVLSNHLRVPCVLPCVCPSIFRYLRDCSLVFSGTLHEIAVVKVKNDKLGVSKKVFILGLGFFGHFLRNRSLKIPNF